MNSAAAKGFNPGFKKIILFSFLLTSIIFWASCNNEEKAPNVSDVQIVLKTRRLDQDLLKIDTAHVADGLKQLSTKYPDFLDFYLDKLLSLEVHGQYADTTAGIREGLHTYLTYKDFRGLFDTVNHHFPNTKMIDDGIIKGFQYMQHYYPNYKTPSIVYFISFLNNWSVVTVDSDIVGIGLDMYLGPGYPYYKSVGIPEYMSEQLKPEAAPVNVFKTIYEEKHAFEVEGHDLLDMMIQRGKEQYFLSKVIPFVPDSVRFGFTTAQLEWCQANEAGIYNFLVKDNLLYETNPQKVVRYVTDGPEAAGMGKGSPGNVGSWLGWQIIKAYLKQHPQPSMDAVFSLSDAQQILQTANYKPR